MKNEFILICLLLMVCGCSIFKGKSAPDPTHVILKFEAADDINPNIKGRASSVVIRIYQLKSKSAFEKADFMDLFDHEKDVLGIDLVENSQEVYLNPSENETVHFVAADKTDTVGILAAFRDYDQGTCKTIADIKKEKTTVINLDVKGTNIQVK